MVLHASASASILVPGFGKTAKQTIELHEELPRVRRLGFPTMVAVSRKSYIGEAYHIEDPKERDSASAAEALMACELGASVIRTHNVALTAQALEENLRPYVLIGMGCNVALVADEGEEREGKIAMINKAIGDMCMLPDAQIIDISSYLRKRTGLFRGSGSVREHGRAHAYRHAAREQLLTYLQAIENSLRRVRTQKNGPRTCDLDILDYQGYVSDLEVLTLPHPLLLERDFVAKPLLEASALIMSLPMTCQSRSIT